MARSGRWRPDERRIISITPVANGIVMPTLATVGALALVVEGATHVGIVHHFVASIAVVVVGPFALVLTTRFWQWRSHKIHVTSDRLIIEGGVLRHTSSSIELADILATRVDQRLNERLSKRGLVLVETAQGTVLVGRVRHPSALCRLIDRERSHFRREALPLDTVFDFEETFDHEVRFRPKSRFEDE